MNGYAKIKEQRRAERSEGRPFVSAIIVAAGKGERMGGGVNKQLIPICRVPVIARTLAAFEGSSSIDEIVVVSNAENILTIADLIREFGFGKVSEIVRGGGTRQQSAARGLSAVREAAGFVAVHDGARPLITPAAIDRVVEEALRCGAAAAAARVKDTIKVADDDNCIVATPERARLWAVQTPQVFAAELYRAALKKAAREQSDYTDDCQLVENIGHKVKLVACDYTNIKITTQDDLAVAESIIRGRGDLF